MMSTFFEIPLAPPGGFQGRGPLGLVGTTAEGAPDTFANILTTAIGVMTIIAFIWFIFLILTGGLGVMSAGGDKTQLESARSKITSGLTGLVIVISSVAIFTLVAQILGLGNVSLFGNIIRDLF